MQDYTVVKITMDTYRYTLFKTVFEQRGITIETRDNPQGTVRLIRKIGSVCGIIAPTVEKLFSEHKVDYGDSAIMRWYTQNTGTLTDKFGNLQYVKKKRRLHGLRGSRVFRRSAEGDNHLCLNGFLKTELGTCQTSWRS